MKTLPDILFYLSMICLVALGIYSQFYFLAILAGGILVSILLVKLYTAYWNAERVRKESKPLKSKVLTKKYKAAKSSRGLPFKAGLLIALASVFSAFGYSSFVDTPEPPPEEFDQEPIEIAYRYTPPPVVVLPKPVEPIKKAQRKVVSTVVIVPDATPVPRKEPVFIEPTTPIEELLATVSSEVTLKIPEPEPTVTNFESFQLDKVARFPTCPENLSNEDLQKCAELEMKQLFGRYAKYPTQAREEGLEGRVYVSFVIDNNGEVTDIQILKEPKDAQGVFAKEVNRVVSKMPKWIPGSKNKKAVKSRYYTSFKFDLH